MIQKLPSGLFRARIFSGGVQVAAKTFEFKRDADAWESEQKRQLHAGEWVNSKLGAVALEKVIADYLDSRRGVANPKTLDTDEANLRIHIPTRLKRSPIRSLTSGKLDILWGDVVRGGVSHSTASRVRDSLSAVFAWAVRQGLLATNPVTASKVPRAPSKRPVQLFTSAELAATLAAHRDLHPGYADVVEFAAQTGLRWGELVALGHADVRWEPIPHIVVSRSASDGYSEKGTKSGKARTVPLTERAQEIIQRQGGGGSLFVSPRGGRLNGGNLKRALNWGETARGHRFHDLRHSAATHWLRAGVDIATVSEWLGHASPRITLEVYVHHLGMDGDAVALDRLRAFEARA